MNRVQSIERGVEILSEWLGEGGVPVGNEEAQLRANICLQCPENRDGNRIIASVAEAIKKHIEIKNHLGLRVSGEKRLKECQVCLCSLRLKIHTPIHLIRDQMQPDEPERFKAANPKCWQIT